MNGAIQLAKKIIEENFDEKISLAFLCKKTGLNECKLKKGFKEIFKVSIKEYQVQIKMTEAKRLLTNTKEKISSIAYAIGYERHASFTLEFKKRFGCAPNAFRKSMGNSDKL